MLSKNQKKVNYYTENNNSNLKTIFLSATFVAGIA